MTSTTNIYCVYFTVYRGNKLPMFYIGSSNIIKINNGYHGSVKSKTYKQMWENEIENNPHLFKTKIISIHNTRQEALDKEHKLQKQLNVVKSTMYVNMALATKNGFFGRNTSKENHPLWGRKGMNNPKFGKKCKSMSKNGRENISKNHADCSGSKNSRAIKWKLTSPDNNEYVITGTLKQFCKEHKLGNQLLRQNLGKTINQRPRSCTHWLSKNTVGWKLEKLS